MYCVHRRVTLAYTQLQLPTQGSPDCKLTCFSTTPKYCSVRDFTCKMRNSCNRFYFSVAVAVAVITAVYSNEWSLDARIDDGLNDLVKTFHSDSERVSIWSYKAII